MSQLPCSRESEHRRIVEHPACKIFTSFDWLVCSDYAHNLKLKLAGSRLLASLNLDRKDYLSFGVPHLRFLLPGAYPSNVLVGSSGKLKPM